MAFTLRILASGLLLTAQSPESPLTARLTSNDVDMRVQAVQELSRAVNEDRFTLRDDGLQQAVVAALEIENEFVGANLRFVLEGRGQSQLTEQYGEHYATLLGLADQLRQDFPRLDPALADRLFRALVFGSYNPQSEFVTNLAEAGEPIVGHVLELTKSPFAENGYALMTELLEKHRGGALRKPLSVTSAYMLRTEARTGLQHPSEEVKRWAIAAVVAAGDRGAILALKQLADRNLASDDPSSTYMRQIVRESALDAVTRLERIR